MTQDISQSFLLMQEDLAKSGLVPVDLHARPLSAPERAMTLTPHSTQGYVIPYTSLDGRPLPFYRVRLFDYTPKYKQPKETQNHVYFPKGFLAAAQKSRYIIITEGEKKAALATLRGSPTCALGGVDSWRTRQIILPKDTELSNLSNERITAHIKAGSEAQEKTSSLATGFQELIDFIISQNKQVIIIFDSDQNNTTPTTSGQVQRAAAALGFSLRFRGVPFVNVRQAILSRDNNAFSVSNEVGTGKTAKLGLDDFILSHDRDGSLQILHNLIAGVLKRRSAFPLHPSIFDFTNKRLQTAKISRRDLQELSIALLSDLDAKGMRLRNKAEDQAYYFDNVSKRLFKVDMTQRVLAAGSPFSRFLYTRFGIGPGDERVIERLSTQFSAEDPIEEVSPYRVFAQAHDNDIHLQISDSRYVTIASSSSSSSSSPLPSPSIRIQANGTNGILFESDQVEPITPEDLEGALAKLREGSHNSTDPSQPLPNWWANVLSSVRLKDQNRQRITTSLLYYISPWLNRWRGTQLPIELVLGESGSGKSTLMELRLAILTGRPHLRNAPQDLKDWHASITNVGGLHVTDNVQLTDRNLRQRLSDDICRIITEPTPYIEMRKYYTAADLMRLPVRTCFAITAIQQPFLNADLLQRAIILELDKLALISPELLSPKPEARSTALLTDYFPPAERQNGSTVSLPGGRDNQVRIPIVKFDATWRDNQLIKYGGRATWIAHHLLVLERFFQLVQQKWDPRYQAIYRLINVEQSMCLMAEVFGIKDGKDWIPKYLANAVDQATNDADWTLSGIKTFVDDHHSFMPNETVDVQLIAEWASTSEEFNQCEMLTSTRRLGRYLATHRALVAESCGLVEFGKKANRATYRMVRPSKDQKKS